MQRKKFIILSITFTTNNTFYSITDLKGNVVFWSSCGVKKQKGTKKMSTILVPNVLTIIKDNITYLGYKYIYIKVKGFSKNKKLTIKCLRQLFSNIILIHEKTFFPHNGCKNSKIKRL
uniref:Ribosomal protein S11 n=1 Tax=Caulacanthus okamurae TaxID=152008 RepID=A0A6H1U992_9FLOR|nr:ribosomal protein S11 [Caulacanthus okamurae]QIZ74780.1 ribosomal protein S11 [Caulacanthus okamurae]